MAAWSGVQGIRFTRLLGTGWLSQRWRCLAGTTGARAQILEPEFLIFLKKPDFNEEEGVFQDTNGSWKQAKIEV